MCSGYYTQLTNSMEQSPWEVSNYSASWETLCLLWNLKVHYHVHKRPPLVPLLSHTHLSHTSHCSLVFILILSSHLCLSHLSGLFLSSFLTKILYIFLIFPVCYMPHPSHPPSFDCPNNIWWSIQVTKLLTVQSFPASHHFLHLRSKYSPQHPVLKQSQRVFFS